MAAPASSAKRRKTDIMKLMMSDYEVVMEGDGSEFIVKFHGPADTLYAGGVWNVQVTLPKDYPFRSPSIGFKNRLFHPNVDEMSGSVCLDVINQTWSPMYDLLNIFDMFLPQLLSYPNASDPLNSDAAALMIQDPQRYNDKVRDYVRRFAAPSGEKQRHLSTDSMASADTELSTDTVTSRGTISSSSTASSAPEGLASPDPRDLSRSGDSPLGGAQTMDLDQHEPRSLAAAAEEEDEDDDLSSLSDSSDTEDNLVLDL